MLADPDFGAGDSTDEDWYLATEGCVRSGRKLIADPRIAELEDHKYAEITRQVQISRPLVGTAANQVIRY